MERRRAACLVPHTREEPLARSSNKEDAVATAVEHYTSYKARPFKREERDKVTILFGGLTWKHERLVQGAFHNMSYKAQPIPNIQRADLEAGKELIDVGACCPTIFTTGSLVNFLKSEVAAKGREDIVNNYLFLTAGACGPCRFGQYHQSYEMALDGLGLKDFRLLLLDDNKMDSKEEGGGLDINLPLSLGIVWAILCADVLTDMEYATRPYEVNPGQTDAVMKESVEILYDVFHKRPLKGKKWGAVAWHFATPYFKNALREVRKKWDEVEVDRLQVKPKVKVTGEFWLQTHEGDGNYNIKRWLEQEGAETIPPPIAIWLAYLLHTPLWRMEKKRHLDKKIPLKMAMVRGFEKLYNHNYNGFRKALGGVPNQLPDQEELKELASPYFHHELRGGEGHMLVGKALYVYHHKKAHMVCELSPYSCMPNTMSVGAMANVQGRYPDLLYAPIEVKGDAEVHALSRCQMILTEAKKRAQSDFEEVLQKTGLSVEDLRRLEARRPELRRASTRIPHHGYSGMAANYAMHLAKRGRA
jgi:predicted nucleotide-binding protein (sugar kinase/HSP70/actin superfamily)